MKFSELLSNKFVRITLMIFFFLFVYKILFAIGIFFAIDSMVLSMYLCWIGMIILFASLLQVKRTNFNVKPPILFSADKIATDVASAAQQAASAVQQVATQLAPPAGPVGIQRGGDAFDGVVHV
jgi:hypothetical protein